MEAPRLKLIVLKISGIGGMFEASVSVAIKVGICPGAPLVGLWLRLRNDVRVPKTQVTTAWLEVRREPPIVAEAVIVSCPGSTAVYVNEADWLLSLFTWPSCGLAPTTWNRIGVPTGSDPKWRAAVNVCDDPCVGLDASVVGVSANDGAGLAEV